MKVTPIIIGALGSTPKLLRKRLEDIGIDPKVVELQRVPSYILQGSSEKFLRFEETCCHRTLQHDLY